jgi:hypothetical protein
MYELQKATFLSKKSAKSSKATTVIPGRKARLKIEFSLRKLRV